MHNLGKVSTRAAAQRGEYSPALPRLVTPTGNWFSPQSIPVGVANPNNARTSEGISNIYVIFIVERQAGEATKGNQGREGNGGRRLITIVNYLARL